MGPHHYYDGWGFGLIWALLNFLFWAAIIGLAIWAVLRLTRSSPPRYPVGPPQAHHRESPREILDRRFASGEIDAAAYEDMRRRIESARPQAAPAPQPGPAPQSGPDQPVQGRPVQDQSEPPSGEDETKRL